VNAGRPARIFLCAVCCKPIGEASYAAGIETRISYCDDMLRPNTAKARAGYRKSCKSIVIALRLYGATERAAPPVSHGKFEHLRDQTSPNEDEFRF